MAIDVFAADEQQDVAVELERWVGLSRAVLRARGIKGDAELSLLFVDRPAMAALNERYLGEEGPTDVLAFPIEDEPVPVGRSPDSGRTGPTTNEGGPPFVLLGDVVICPSVAQENARRNGGPTENEIALLVVHGILHLLGMDHQERDEAEAMERLERKLLGRFHLPEGADAAGRSEATARSEAAAGWDPAAVPGAGHTHDGQ